MRIQALRPAALAPPDEARTLRQALAARPNNHALRMRLATLLLKLDHFAEVRELLAHEETAPSGYAAQLTLANALLAARGPADDNRAAALCERAAETAAPGRERARALALQAKALLRMGQTGSAEELLRSALREEPGNMTAFKRLVLSLLQASAFGDVLELVTQLEGAGVSHARMLAARAVALAGLGDHEEARSLFGYDRFVAHHSLPTPSGWSDSEEFARALESAIDTNRTSRRNRYGTSSRQTWRIDDPLSGDDPAMRALIAAIVDAVADYAGSLDDEVHPWVRARPQDAVLRSWCVIVEGDGWEEWHTHPNGWISGGYYIRVPDAVANGSDEAGCFALGLADGLAGTDAAQGVGQRLIRPQTGSLVLFPSHGYHRTYPHRGESRRICLAFDVGPV